MYIEKIFSDYNSGENLYSVIMNEDEYALFSSAKDNDDKTDLMAGIAIGTGATGYGLTKGKLVADNYYHSARGRAKRFFLGSTATNRSALDKGFKSGMRHGAAALALGAGAYGTYKHLNNKKKDK